MTTHIHVRMLHAAHDTFHSWIPHTWLSTLLPALARHVVRFVCYCHILFFTVLVPPCREPGFDFYLVFSFWVLEVLGIWMPRCCIDWALSSLGAHRDWWQGVNESILSFSFPFDFAGGEVWCLGRLDFEPLFWV